MLGRTRLGHHMYAVGGSKDVARLSGLRTWAPVVAAHVLCSALAGLAGVLLLSRVGVGKSTAGLTGSYELSRSPPSCSAAPCSPGVRAACSAPSAAS